MRKSILVLSAALVVAACSSTPSSPAAPAASTRAVAAATASSSACSLRTAEDLIERDVIPGRPATAMLIGDVDLAHCRRTVDSLTVTVRPGYCVQVARAVDNPGYNVDAVPAPKLQRLLAEKGAGCR